MIHYIKQIYFQFLTLIWQCLQMTELITDPEVLEHHGSRLEPPGQLVLTHEVLQRVDGDVHAGNLRRSNQVPGIHSKTAAFFAVHEFTW